MRSATCACSPRRSTARPTAARSCGTAAATPDVFAHGHCQTDTDHYLKWFEVPAVLARAGYVVAVPRLPQIAGGTSPLEADSDLALLRDLVAWLRSAWAERAQLAAAPATGLAGHSFGAGLAGRLAGEGNLRAFASLSGSVARVTRDGIHVPKLPLPLTLTVEQQSFAGGWLSGFPLLADEAGSCHVSLSWETSEETGSTTQP